MRFLDFLFEKDEVEDIEEEVVQKEVEQPILKKPITKQEEVIKPIVNSEPVVVASKSKHITLDEIQPKQIKAKAVETPKQPYIFNPPISPIFGVMKEKENEKPKVIVSQKQKENTSKLGTVLSPYYGQGFVDEPLAKSKEIIEEQIISEKLVSDLQESVFNNDLTSELDSMLEQEEYVEFDGLTIDDIIEQANEISDSESDKKVIITENISLFDGDIE